MDPSDPTAGTVTYADSNENVDEKKRDYDQERTTQSITFNIPEEKAAREKKPQEEPEAEITPELRLFLLSTALCNLATVRYDENDQAWQTTGEPTEIALQVFAHRFNVGKKNLRHPGGPRWPSFPSTARSSACLSCTTRPRRVILESVVKTA